MATAANNKATVYIDVDDEITNIIDKVKGSDAKIVALVLPKRAAVLQSVVNMKLLKKAGQNAKKNIVLITSEQGLLPLAGAAGLHVAKSLQSKPDIPPAPTSPADDETLDESEDGAEPKLDTAASVGALAAAAENADDTETIELDNVDPETATPVAGLAAKAKKLKHLKVPNFEKFRLGFFLAGLGVVLLILGWFLAFIIMPKAQITIKTDTTTVVSSFDFTASTNQTELDIPGKKIPAMSKEVKKTDTETVPATGQRDEGTKATGKVTLKLTNCAEDEVNVPAGTVVTTGGLSFLTQKAANLESVEVGGNCRNNDFPNISSKTVEVTAQNNGDNGNIGSGKTFAVSGFASVTGTNSEGFGGGTSKIIKVVSQKDIDDALAKMKSRQDETAKEELKGLLETESLYALTETLLPGAPATTPTPAVDAEATEVTVKADTSYTMLGIKKDDLSQIIKDDVKADIDTEKQAITKDGIDESIMRINNQPTPAEAFISFRTSVTAGPELDENAIKEAVRGKKRGEVQDYITDLPGVTDVTVNYSPFWVYSTPKAAKKITITVEKTSDEQQPTTTDEQ
jgi:hypothetical protein